MINQPVFDALGLIEAIVKEAAADPSLRASRLSEAYGVVRFIRGQVVEDEAALKLLALAFESRPWWTEFASLPDIEFSARMKHVTESVSGLQIYYSGAVDTVG